MNPFPSASLRFLSLNVNGLSAPAKRRNLFGMLLEQGWDVVCLQETHHPSGDEAARWCREGAGPGRPWQGHAFWNKGTSASRGVGVLIRLGAPVRDVTLTTQDDHGRLLRVDLTCASTPLTIICVYAPAEVGPTQTSFFRSSLMPIIPADRKVLLGGDFNCIAEDRDRLPPTATSHRRHGHTTGLSHVELRFALTDIWRDNHPSDIDFTHTSVSTGTSARLDRWLISHSLRTLVRSTSIVHGFPGDHCAVAVSLACEGDSRGPGLWCFPLSLLQDEPFARFLSHHILHFLATNQLHPTSLNRRTRWDMLKTSIRDVTQQYSLLAARARNKADRRLQSATRIAKAAYIANPTDPITLETWCKTHHDLQSTLHRAATSAALRAGAVWQDFGEQPTHFFHWIAAERARATHLTTISPHATATPISLDTPAGRTRGAALLVATFSSDSPTGLFHPRPTDTSAQALLLDSVDTRLPPTSTLEMDNPITTADLLAALRTTSRGKRPGSDGLPYEFYQHFWPVLGNELSLVLDEGLTAPSTPSLSASQRQGLITLLFKGGPASQRDCIDAYRPITLLNTDAKLLAKALALRWGPHLTKVIDVTQTGFLPGRFIGDNILAHLEEVDYLEATHQPGCMVFLDFAKAYDRLDRSWLRLCMHRLGFGPGAMRYLDLLLADTEARVLFNGWRTAPFPVRSGVPQGSPLSPLLYVVAAQPLASRLRLLTIQGLLHPIRLPDGTWAPVSHQHADDTTLHVRSVRDVCIALHDGIEVFAAASGAALQLPKCSALLLGGQPPPPPSECPIPFLPRGSPIRHLGIQIGTNPKICADLMFTSIIRAIQRRIAHWSTQQLTLLGRIYVAKQTLASMLYHHGTYLMPSPTHLRQLETLLTAFVGRATLICPQARPTTLHPQRQFYFADFAVGGLQMADIRSQLQALQAKIAARLLQPENLPWKTMLRAALSGYHIPTHPLAPWHLGASLLVSTFPINAHHLSSRAAGYVTAFRNLHPHRPLPLSSLSPHQVLCEPLFYNPIIMDTEGSPFGGTTWLHVAQQGITRVRHLRAALLTDHPPSPIHNRLQSLYAALPQEWRETLSIPPPAPEWFMDASTPPPIVPKVWQWDPLTSISRCFTLSPSRRLQLFLPSPSPPPQTQPCLVLSWCPTWGKRNTNSPLNPSSPPSTLQATFLVGPWTDVDVDASLWHIGPLPLLSYQVRAAATRARTLNLIHRFPGYIHGDAIRPRSWPTPPAAPPWSRLRPLIEMEASWSSIVQAGGPRRRRNRSRADFEQGTTPALWMLPTSPRIPVHLRIATRRDNPNPSSPTPNPTPQASWNGRVDPLTLPLDHRRPPWQSVYSRLHDPSIDRGDRGFGWQLLHGALLPRAARCAYSIGEDPEPGHCPYPTCDHIPETITHVLLDCPLARRVTRWLCDLWAAVAGEANRPPRTPAVLFGDDQRSWQPRYPHLWLRLRLTTLHTLWRKSRSTQMDTPGHPTAASIVAEIIYTCRTAIRQDWCRVIEDVRASSAAPLHWFRGRDPALTAEAFRDRWTGGGVLATLPSGPLGCTPLTVQWSCSYPVSLPTP